MNLTRATMLASLIKDVLAPMCEKIEIAGSIRRGRPEVGDIDLVILPRPGQLAAIKARCRQRSEVVRDGDQNAIFRLQSGMQLDVFFAKAGSRDLLRCVPGNFGTLLLCRTGSREHNIWLVEHAKRMGLTWNPYRGVLDGDGDVLASETEVDVFRALDLDYVAPQKRER